MSAVQGHQYFMNEVEVPKSSEFNLSSAHKWSTDFGMLVPSMPKECYPGETYRFNMEQLVRFQPLAAPVMHECSLDINFFFVPFRLLWDEWPEFITGDTAASHPYCAQVLTLVNSGDLGDYLGYTPGGTAASFEQPTAFPIAAYLKIYDDWYRDQNLVAEQFPDGGLVAGDNGGTLNGFLTGNPLPGSLQHDYFTSCLPFPQKGPDVRIPVFVNGDGVISVNTSGDNQLVLDPGGTPVAGFTSLDINASGELEANSNPAFIDPNGTLVLSQSEIGTIRALRLASVLQEWYEKQSVAGSRYNETILAHFATHTGDARLQRAEHLGGFTQKVRFSEVLSTAQTEVGADTFPVGYMGGHGISYGDTRRFSYTAKEHGYIMAIQRFRPTTSYYQGLNRIMTRRTVHDYMWPTFANVGDQAVLVKELFLGKDISGTDVGGSTDDLNEVFGYQERYAELKTGFDTVHGDFRDTLRFWDLTRGFDDYPALSLEFISAVQEDFNRIFVVPEGPHHILVQQFFNCMAYRPLPVYSDPTL